MTPRVLVLHPFAFAVYPILSFARHNWGWERKASDLLLPLLLSIVVATGAWLLARWKVGSARARLLASLLVLCLLWYGLYFKAFGADAHLDWTTHTVAIVVWGALFGGAWLLACRLRRIPAALNTYLNLFSVFLLLFPVAGVVTNASRSRDFSPLVGMDDAGVRASSAPESKPDLYLLVLDGYGASRFLEREFDFDNTSFERALQQRGFVVPPRARANYVRTHVSLASMLNWTHLMFLEDYGPGRDPSLVYHMIENNRAARYLKSRGYEFVFLPTSFRPTSRNRLADREIRATRSAGRDLVRSWWAQTPFISLEAVGCRVLGCETRGWFPYPPESGQDIREKFRHLERLAREPGAQFVFAHLLAPHPPFVLRDDCSSREPSWPSSEDPRTRQRYRTGYVESLECLNVMILELVDRILEQSAGSAIILLQSDHGTVRDISFEPIPLEEVDPDRVAERSSVFAAYHLPGIEPGAIPDSITPINVFPLILNRYFGEEIPYRDDATYWSYYSESHRFERVDERQMAE